MMAEKKKSKYDTNPLDTEYARRADDEWGARRVAEAEPKAKEVWPAEAPTKRYDSSIPVSYPSVNVPPSYPPKPVDATSEVSAKAPSSTRAVPGLGLPENITCALPYAPFYIGAVAAVLELFLTPREETRARFHASQGLVLHLAAIAINTILNIVGGITGSYAGEKIFWGISTAFFIIALIRVLRGESLHVAAADDAARFLSERIDPQKIQKKK
jgi:uncharacterized membrane protein